MREMRSTRKDPKFALVRGVIVFMLAACGSTSGLSGSQSSSVSQSSGGSPSLGGSPSKSAAATNSSAPKNDPLTGAWQSDPITAADVDANLRRSFSRSAVDAWERAQTHGGCYLKASQTAVQILHFDGGQLVISSAVNGGPAREGWTGSYAVKDTDTFRAGGDQ